MKKLSLSIILESFFHPEVPGPRNANSYRNDKIEKSPNNFPYTEINSEENMSDDEIAQELKLEFFVGNTTPSGRDLTLLRRVGGYSQSWTGGKGSHSFGDFLTKEDPESISEKDKTHAIDTSYMNYHHDDDLKNFDELTQEENEKEISEAMGRDPGQFNTRNVSTKQPFANGIPRGKDPFHTYESDEPEGMTDDQIEDELHLSLESLFEYTQTTKYADSAYSILNQGKKMNSPRSDLDFFDKIAGRNKYVMVPEEEFEIEDEVDDEEGY